MLQLLSALSSVDEWSYDAFRLEAASGGRPLSALSFALFKRSGIASCLQLNESKLARSVHGHFCMGKEAHCGNVGRGAFVADHSRVIRHIYLDRSLLPELQVPDLH